MAERGGQERSEKATPKKREEARGRGQVARSNEVVSVAAVGAGLIALDRMGPAMLERLSAFFRGALIGSGSFEVSPGGVQAVAMKAAGEVALVVLPFAGIVALAGVGANVAQTGFLFAPSAAAPKYSRLDPIAGLGRIFSGRGAVEALKAFLKVALVCIVAALCVRARLDRLAALLWQGAPALSAEIWDTTYYVSMRILGVLLFLAAIDYGIQRWRHEQDLRMSREEVREESRQQEGDPLVKARIRSLQKERARRRMMQEVPKADVVVTNPTHYAVALRYDAGTMHAPAVVAKGMNLIAERIKAIAAEHGVPVVENAPLARAVYKSVKVGGAVPVAFYRAVAEILALAYRLKGRVS